MSKWYPCEPTYERRKDIFAVIPCSAVRFHSSTVGVLAFCAIPPGEYSVQGLGIPGPQAAGNGIAGFIGTSGRNGTFLKVSIPL